ncbi:putative zinc finger protein [Nemania diffusa]|nr:putative zinc finger protein [Nemania diffusa]
MASRINPSSFDKALGEFKEGLGRREIEEFRTTTLKELKISIGKLQAQQHAQGQQQDLNRLQPFIEAIEQYGKMVGIFYSNDDIVTFVWGPVKFLLQATSIVDGAFCELLNAYELMGESFPLLAQYEDLFYTIPHTVLVLPHICEDILKFHRILLRYFQRPQWQSVFSETWDVCKSRFSSIIHNIARHRSLIESQANPSQIEEVRGQSLASRKIQNDQLDEQDLQRIRDVNNWLRAPNVEVDQNNYTKARAEYPATGKWLLGTTLFKEWFDPQFAAIPPLLWLNGIPGAGKTILASLVVEEARKLSPAPTVLFFYCKYGNSERDSFVALGRSLLVQFLKHDSGLLPSFYQKSCRSGEAVLTSPALVEELLHLAFTNCKSAYIILDGLDECPRDQRKYITQWFRKLVDELPTNEPDRLRCLFVSQDDGAARKDFADLANIKIRAQDNTQDIEEYSRIEANKLKESYPSIITEAKANKIAKDVAKVANGLFLLAKSIWINLSGHTSITRLEEVLKLRSLPNEINDAYSRIMARMAQEVPPAAMDDRLRLLCWLVCAKRPLKWHEIQGMNSVSLDGQCIAFERQGFIKSPKELCASLVEIQPDGRLEFVHPTAKVFLVEKNYVDAPATELKLATLCIDYLNLPAFIRPPTVDQMSSRDGWPSEERILNGEYGFMDYAIIYWLQHLEAGVAIKTDEEKELMELIAESLEIFVNHHWASPKTILPLAKGSSEKLQFFKTLAKYDRLEQAVASTRRQLKCFGKMKEDEIALDLVRIVGSVRHVLEAMLASSAMGTCDQEKLIERYGEKHFKCPRFSCQFFTDGFATAAERDKHISQHERPFRCSEEKCTGYAFGFASAAECEKHVRETHFTAATRDEEFLTDQDVQRSMLNTQLVANEIQSITDSEPVVIQQPELELESGPETEHELQQLMPRRKRQRQTEFKCQYCDMVYRKRYNWQSHLRIHEIERLHVCDLCGKEFARSSDHTRHLKTHTGDKEHVCRGVLQNGNTWGCGRMFSRAETLRKHHESRVGQACIQPLQQQQQEHGEPSFQG